MAKDTTSCPGTDIELCDSVSCDHCGLELRRLVVTRASINAYDFAELVLLVATEAHEDLDEHALVQAAMSLLGLSRLDARVAAADSLSALLGTSDAESTAPGHVVVAAELARRPGLARRCADFAARDTQAA